MGLKGHLKIKITFIKWKKKETVNFASSAGGI